MAALGYKGSAKNIENASYYSDKFHGYWQNGEKLVIINDSTKTDSGEYIFEIDIADCVENFPEELEKFFPKAQIILATTTPMNPVHPETINPRTTEEIVEYNRILKEVAREKGLPINDLFEESKEWGEEFYLDYCHLVEEGYERLAKKVTEAVSHYL